MIKMKNLQGFSFKEVHVPLKFSISWFILLVELVEVEIYSTALQIQ